MARFKNPLDHVQVAAPCKADWDQMIGSDRVRFCGQCSLNVYNLSAMSRSDAESLIARTEGAQLLFRRSIRASRSMRTGRPRSQHQVGILTRRNTRLKSTLAFRRFLALT